MRYDDAIMAFSTGWSRRKAVSVETGIGIAYSYDEGLTFQRAGNGPVLTASLSQPFLVGDAFVRHFDDEFHMWYIHGKEWKKYAETEDADRIYKIGYATSKDAVCWTPREGDQLIPDMLGADECQALPSVIQVKGTYHMIFCLREAYNFRNVKGRGYRLGYARSVDLENWERADNELSLAVSDDDWDSEMQAYPHICEIDGRTLLLYNGNKFGRYGFGLAELSL